MSDAPDWHSEDEPIAPQEVTRIVGGEQRTAYVHVQFRVRLQSNCGVEWAHDASKPVSFVGHGQVGAMTSRPQGQGA